MIRFTRHSLYGMIISAAILVVITMVVLFRTQISLAFGQKGGTFPNILLLGLILAEVLTGFLLIDPRGNMQKRRQVIKRRRFLSEIVD